MVKRLSSREKQELLPFVTAAQQLSSEAHIAWVAVGALLDKFDSYGHSQCCPVGGIRMGGRNGSSGITPCPCGWDAPESVEDVLRRVLVHIAKPGDLVDIITAGLVADALAALDRAKQ